MPPRSWLNWLQGIRLPPSSNETPTTRKKRLLKTPHNRLWPSEKKNWQQALENNRRERAAAIEERRLAAREALNKEHEKGRRSLERIRRLEWEYLSDALSENKESEIIKVKRALKEMNGSAKRKGSATRKESAKRKGSSKSLTRENKLREAVKAIGKRGHSRRA